MQVHRILPHFLLALAVMAGCEEEGPYELSQADASAWAEAVCAARERCCEAAPDCVEQETTWLLGLPEWGGGELAFVEDCLTHSMHLADEHACTPGLTDACALAYGAGEEEEPCMEFSGPGLFGSTCGAELACVSGICVRQPFVDLYPARVGERCNPPFRQCDAGLYCSSEMTCREQQAEGDPCTEPTECELALYCTQAGRCASAGDLGEPCEEGVPNSCGFSCTDESCTRMRCSADVCVEPLPTVCEASSMG